MRAENALLCLDCSMILSYNSIMTITREVVYAGENVTRRTEKLRQIRTAIQVLRESGLPDDIDMEKYENHEMAHVIFSRNGMCSHIEAGKKIDESGDVVSWYLQHLHSYEERMNLTGVEIIRESLAPIMIKTRKPVSELSRKDVIDAGAGVGQLVIDGILKLLGD